MTKKYNNFPYGASTIASLTKIEMIFLVVMCTTTIIKFATCNCQDCEQVFWNAIVA